MLRMMTRDKELNNSDNGSSRVIRKIAYIESKCSKLILNLMKTKGNSKVKL